MAQHTAPDETTAEGQSGDLSPGVVDLGVVSGGTLGQASDAAPRALDEGQREASQDVTVEMRRLRTAYSKRRLWEAVVPQTGCLYMVEERRLNAGEEPGDAVALKSAFNRYTALPAYSVNAPTALPGIDYSDHRNYWSAGISAVMVTDTAFYRNPNYHTAGDRADTLDYEKMAEVVRGVYHFLMEQQTSD